MQFPCYEKAGTVRILWLSAQEAGSRCGWSTGSGGTASRGTNYTLRDGTLTFQPGETVKTLEIDIKANGMNEPDRPSR